MSTVDPAADVARILGSTADFTRTAATWASSSGSASDAVTGILWESTFDELGELATAPSRALFVVATTEFSAVTVRQPEDTVTVTGQAAWNVLSVKERVAHVFAELGRDTILGRTA